MNPSKKPIAIQLRDAYKKLNRVAVVSRCSRMDVADFRLFTWIIDHAQQVLRLEAELAGIEIEESND